jgi:hypothetical protein
VTRLAAIPATGRAILGLHAAWGLFLWLGYDWLGDGADVARPLLIACWFGTTAMFLVFGLLVASAGWRRNETALLAVLLVFDAAAIALVVEMIRAG